MFTSHAWRCLALSLPCRKRYDGSVMPYPRAVCVRLRTVSLINPCRGTRAMPLLRAFSLSPLYPPPKTMDKHHKLPKLLRDLGISEAICRSKPRKVALFPISLRLVSGYLWCFRTRVFTSVTILEYLCRTVFESSITKP